MRDFLDGAIRQSMAHPARSLFLILALAVGALSFSVGMGLSSRLASLRGEFSGDAARFTIGGGTMDASGDMEWKMPPQFSLETIAALKQEIPQVTAVSQVNDVRWFQVQAGQDRYSIRRVLGVGSDYPAVMGLSLKQGRWFGAQEEADAAKVAVISESVASIMFGGAKEALGGTITSSNAVMMRRQGNRSEERRMSTTAFTVIGVYQDPSDFLIKAYGAPDAIVPSTASSFSFGPFAGSFRSLVARTDGLGPEKLRVKVAAFLESQGVADPAVTVWEGNPDSPGEMTAADTKAAMSLFATALTALAFVILALSAVGVFSSVNTEVADATKSICVRRALGADKPTIARSYLAKGLAFGLAGGLLGALGSYPAYAMVSKAAGLAMERLGLSGLSLGALSPAWLILGVLATAAMSVLFSLIPAVRASNLSIVEGIKEL